MYEKDIEQLLQRFHQELLRFEPGLRLISSQRALPSGRIIDLCFEDAVGTHFIVELKRQVADTRTASQVIEYLAELCSIEPTRKYIGVIAAHRISARTRAHAEQLGIRCWEVDEELLYAIAKREGFVPTSLVRQVRIARDPRSPLPPARKLRTKSTSRPDAVLHLEALYREFPPGTMDATKTLDELRRYWKAACPQAPIDHVDMASELSLHCLRSVHGASVGRRSISDQEPYTTIENLNGVKIAAIDPRKLWVKLDFLLPRETAKKCYEKGLTSEGRDRRKGRWVLSNVPTKLTVENAKALLCESFRFQFGAVRRKAR